MFRKRLRLKKATKYAAPKYPVMESGEVLSLPSEFRLGDWARHWSRPLLPAVLSAGVVASDPASTVDARPAIVRLLAPRTDLPAAPQDAPRRVRKLTEEEVQSLLQEIKLEYDYPENVRGRVALRMPPLTESQGREILIRFLTKNGLSLRPDRRIQKSDMDFVLDGYDSEKKIGYEYVPSFGDEDLSPEEIAALERGIDGEHLLVIREPQNRLPSPAQVVRWVEQAAAVFLERLYREGVLGRAKEIQKLIADLLASDADAEAALVKIGPEALGWLERVEDERAERVARAVADRHLRPTLDALDADLVEDRDDATRRLIEWGAVVLPYVEERLRDSHGNAEVEARCEFIRKTIREEQP